MRNHALALVVLLVANGAFAKEAAKEAPKKAEATQRPANAPMSDDTDEERLRALEEMVRRYEGQALDYREQVRAIAERKYKQRRERIETSFDKALRPVTVKERRYRLEAIAAFEKFLKRHPDEPTYTPDAMFRLAELYFEKSDDLHQQRIANFRDAYDTWRDEGEKGEPPNDPLPDFGQTIALYRDLIERFPDYRLLDGAYYLLGYTLGAEEKREEGIAVWKTLVDRYPETRFFAEVWFRIGDHYFDEEKWRDAIASFSRVTPKTESPYYDKALYKLAWTHYLIDEFDESVQTFFLLLDYSFAKKEEEKDEATGSVLEEESIQYVAISFSDDNWQRPDRYRKRVMQDGMEDITVDYVAFALDYFRKAGKKPYERDVMAKLGDLLFKQTREKQAIRALKHAIELDPMHRDAPRLQDILVQAYERMRDFDSASKERDLLVARYSEGTAWAEKWQTDSEIRKEARTLARTSLYKAAIFYHQQANSYFEKGEKDQAVRYYDAAAAAYGDYLARYPHDKEAYELSFYLAETYYYSLDFDRAASAYSTVRDSTLGTKYKADAALNVVYSLERVVKKAELEGTIPPKDPFAKAESGTTVEKPEEIAPLRIRYIQGIDAFLALRDKDKTLVDDKSAANFAYTAGAIFYAHGHYDEANNRFESIIEDYPDQEAARFAANFVLDKLIADKKWDEVEKRAASYSKTMGDDGGTFETIQGGARFEIAKRTLEEGDAALKDGRVQEGIEKLEAGAATYLALVKENPKREYADLMMYNAALSLEKARRPMEAAGLYERLYKEYPKSDFADRAMFQVASKSEQGFDFEKAVTTYLALVKRYTKSELRPDAQINAALALEGQQKYSQAANEYVRFAKLFPERAEAPEVFFRAALVHKKRDDSRRELSTLRAFIKRYKSNKAVLPRIVEAHTRIGDIYAERARKSKKSRREARKSAGKSYGAALSTYKRTSSSPTATYFAGKAAFQLASAEYDGYEAMKIVGNTGKKQAQALIAKSKRLTEVEKSFQDVITSYRQAEWSLASLYRIGSLYDDLQKNIFDAPCPRDIRRIDEIACDEYRILLEDKAYAVEEKAVEAYRIAYTRAQELKVRNQWTDDTLKSLNRLRSADYPIDNEPLSHLEVGETYTFGLVLPDGGARELKKLGGK